MGIVDEIRLRGVSSRVTEEMLYAEALREVEDGLRRDGLWAKALSQSNMRQDDAMASYLKLRVQSLRDEIELAMQEVQRRTRRERDNANESLAQQRSIEHSVQKRERDRPPQGFRDWLNVLVGLVAVVVVGVVVAALFGKLK